MSFMESQTPRESVDIRIAVPWGHVIGRWYGNRKVRPILALHGWLDNMGTWDTLIPLLPTHIGVLCVDFPGHGRSSKYPKGMTYHVIDYVHIVMRIMKELNWHKVSIMAHSMGSIVGFLYSSMYPRTVDMFIAIDLVVPVSRPSDYDLRGFAVKIEKRLIEDERLDSVDEPPSYTYDELERILYEGSWKSVDMANCKYILNPSITKSSKYPDKYYFSRDGRVKYYVEFASTLEQSAELAKRVRNVPYIVVKGKRSKYINKDTNEIMQILRQNSPHFEFHEIDGTHHVHLNNAKEVAAVLNPFINRHRPADLNSWTMDESESVESDGKEKVTGGSRAGRRLKQSISSKL